MEDFFLPVIFGMFSFAIWNPDFWSEFSWPTVGFLVVFTQFFPEERSKYWRLFFVFKDSGVCRQFSEKKRVERVAILYIHTVVSVFQSSFSHIFLQSFFETGSFRH